jgi:hypothetical protein
MYPPELKKKGRDVDNLSQSVFSAVVNSNKGWFGGKRPNIQWWRASKCPHQEGCQIEIHASKAPLFDFNEDDIIVRDIFRTDKLEPAYLENRQEEDFDNYKNRLRGWLQEKACPVKAKGAFAVWLRFPSKKVNLGEIPTGHIKP